MNTIRSPLGALGALLVLLQGISAGAIAVLQNQAILQFILVITMVIIAVVITGVVTFVVIRFTLRNPGLLFNPQDIDPSVHKTLYASESGKISITLIKESPQDTPDSVE